MRNLWRALKVTFKYKPTIICSIVCAFLLAICWGGNITAVYPLVQISFQGENVPQWLNKKIEENEKELTKLQEEAALLAQQTPISGSERVLEQKKKANQIAQNLQQKSLRWYYWSRPYIEKYAPTDPFMTIVYLMVLVVIGTIIKSIFAFFHGLLSSRLGQLGSMEIREICFDRLLHYEVNHFTQQGVSDAMSRFTGDMGTLSGGLSLVYGKLVREPLKMIACIAGALWVSWQLFLFTCLFMPLAFFLLQWMAKSLKRVARNAMAEMANLYDRIAETFRAVRVVKAFNRENYEQDKFHQTNLNCYKRGMKIAKYGSLVNPFIETMATVVMIIAVLVGAWLVTNETTSIFGIRMTSKPLDLGALVLFYGFLLGAADPVRRLSDFFLSLQSAAAAGDRVYEIIDREVPLTDPDSPVTFDSFSDSIAFRNISFAYSPNTGPAFGSPNSGPTSHRHWAFWRRRKKDSLQDFSSSLSPITEQKVPEPRIILKNVTLEIPFGHTVAIVGPSGCGKSTLLNLIPRFYDPTEGTVEMDGHPLPTLAMRDIRKQLGIVAQESILFNESVFENIRYGVPDATEEQVIEAAKMAFAHQFITEDLEKGYDTMVGPGGGQLSGGQRQRIALARALLKQPQILLLDEATSQIDIQSEQYIHQALAQLTGSRTIIIVTHRLTAIRLADKIVCMRDGQVEAMGTHEEVLAKSPFYEALWKQEITAKQR